MNQTPKTLYTAQGHVTGGREGTARSSDGRLDIALGAPGRAGAGTNSEQLFAAGWSACFEGAMGIVAKRYGIDLPADLAIDTEVDLRLGEDGYTLAARLKVSLPGLDRAQAQAVIDAAERTCPYSKPVAGNIDAAVILV